MSAGSAPSLRARAVAWLARRDHSRAELARKLQAVAAAEARTDEVEPLLDWLQARGYLSDERFAESRVQARAARLGTRRIEAELRQHGVALPPDARDALAASEGARAREVWQRKFGTAAADPREQARQARFLLGRGFDPALVRRLVAGSSDDD